MTLDAICVKVFEQLTRSTMAVVKTVHPPTGEEVFGLIFRQDDELAVQMQEGYCPVIYPLRNTWELVEVAHHHPQNNLLKKYNIYPEVTK